MTTAEALERMTDAGQFEILATRSLRVLELECRSIVHFGVNEQGKTPLGGVMRNTLRNMSRQARVVASPLL